MEGPQVKLNLAKLRDAMGSDKSLKTLVKKALEEMAERHQVEAKLVLTLVDEVVEKIKDDSQKWSAKAPYPPNYANNMSIQIELPKIGRAGVVEYNVIVDV